MSPAQRRSEVLKVRITPAMLRDLKRRAVDHDMPLSRLCYYLLKGRDSDYAKVERP